MFTKYFLVNLFYTFKPILIIFIFILFIGMGIKANSYEKDKNIIEDRFPE